jgi:hypothetical protein
MEDFLEARAGTSVPWYFPLAAPPEKLFLPSLRLVVYYNLNILAEALCCLFIITWFKGAAWIILGWLKDVLNFRNLKL